MTAISIYSHSTAPQQPRLISFEYVISIGFLYIFFVCLLKRSNFAHGFNVNQTRWFLQPIICIFWISFTFHFELVCIENKCYWTSTKLLGIIPFGQTIRSHFIANYRVKFEKPVNKERLICTHRTKRIRILLLKGKHKTRLKAKQSPHTHTRT